MTRRERLHDARHRGARGALVAVLLGGIAVEVPAQEPVPAFPAEAKVVLLDLVVRDAKGRPVADLRQDELAIFEDGAPCEVVSFRLVREAERVASAEASAAEPRPCSSSISSP